MDISAKLSSGVNWIANNPRKVAIGAISKGTIIGAGVAAYQTFGTHSKSSNTSSQTADSMTKPQSKTDEFANHFAEDLCISLLGGTTVFAAAKAFSKYHAPIAAKTAVAAQPRPFAEHSTAV